MAWDTNFRLPGGAFFSQVQFKQVEALFRAIHPRDPGRGIPGADDCGAARFLDLLLQRNPSDDGLKIHQDLEVWKKNYPIWLEKLDHSALAMFGQPIVGLTDAQVTQLLRELESRHIDSFGSPDEQTRTFETMWRHCLQGCWSDPRWGGNRNQIMWRWLGYLQDAKPVEL